ncbi:acyl-ACP thioesterase domain-containing protein [Cloacibacillus sp. An23]|uniref:acyl-[acyl-carrier-protein] thioesterase n=1 Tax=Cloacibacillus sp. An23 TaxID=1965591 RepID=UPI000B36B772|nr:acyl-ACP thioesterase domain-containing protein [Cloacibacillus sp. An23]OUO95117.1 hypothetical protein B5F39_00890 [Cloacibacillus sp. An23]
MTELENLLPYSGIDPRGRVKFSVLLEMFQRMADVDASQYGLSVHQLLKHNMTWVLRNYRIELERYPTQESGNIRIKTYAEPYRNLFSLRFFKMWDSHGEFIGSAYTWWVLLDFARQRPIRLDKCDVVRALWDNATGVFPPEVKIPEASAPTLEETWKVRWQDLDMNDHTNHAVYFNWALDTVPDEVPELMEPVLTEAEFLHPVPRTRVRCLTQEIPSEKGRAFLHSIRHIEDDTEYAKLYSRWAEK